MISRFFIERPILANVLAFITVIIGLVSFSRLPTEQYPPIVPPTIQVTSRYPGASADVVAATIGVPIEQAVNGVEGAIYMSSTSSSDGSYTLTITFDVGTDLNTSLALVQNLVNTSLAQLPGGVVQQGVNVRKVSTNILLVVSIFSEDNRFDEAFLSNYAIINMQNPLARLSGVGQVRVFGSGPYSMRVWLDPKRLQDFGLTTQDVLNAVGDQNIQVVAGQLGAPRSRPARFTSSPSTAWGGSPTSNSLKTSSSRAARGQRRGSCGCATSPVWTWGSRIIPTSPKSAGSAPPRSSSSPSPRQTPSPSRTRCMPRWRK